MDDNAVVFATVSCVSEFDGRSVHIQAGECWAADDPFVRAHGDMFGPPPRVRRTGPVPVERATRAPGEVRPPRGLRK